MLPSKSDPKWKAILTDPKDAPVSGLSTKMMLMRVKMMVKMDPSPAAFQSAVDSALDFFSKNEAAVQNDIKALFG